MILVNEKFVGFLNYLFWNWILNYLILRYFNIICLNWCDWTIFSFCWLGSFNLRRWNICDNFCNSGDFIIVCQNQRKAVVFRNRQLTCYFNIFLKPIPICLSFIFRWIPAPTDIQKTFNNWVVGLKIIVQFLLLIDKIFFIQMVIYSEHVQQCLSFFNLLTNPLTNFYLKWANLKIRHFALLHKLWELWFMKEINI